MITVCQILTPTLNPLALFSTLMIYNFVNGVWLFILYKISDYLLFPEFLKINKTIFLNFKF